MKKNSIFVVQPSLPPLKELIPYLEQVWENKMLSNGGPFHQQLEDELCRYLDVPYISLVSNGTMGLITALQALDIRGEVITTPYSYVATSQSLMWNKIKPVFVDIDPITLNLDPKKIEAAITQETSAIMPVHVYGKPCDVDAIDILAKKHGLKVIYDAAHAFGVRCHCGSLLKHGDLSVLSFHATKVFNTFEGGAIACKDKEIKQKIDQIKNFGITSETNVEHIGINGKMSEFNSVLGLLQLKYIEDNIKKRKAINNHYRNELKKIKGIRCHSFSQLEFDNYSYFPIFVDDEYTLTRDQLYKKLKDNGINGRRYFYPLITDFPIFKNKSIKQEFNLPIAKETSDRVICLPIYSEMELKTVEKVLDLIKH